MAVKMLQPQVSDRDKKVKFLKEAAIMGQFLHPNIVKLHGVVTVNEPVSGILQYVVIDIPKGVLVIQQFSHGCLISTLSQPHRSVCTT